MAELSLYLSALLVFSSKKRGVEFIIAPDQAADMDNSISHPSAASVGEKTATATSSETV